MDELIPWSNFHAVGRELEYLTDAFKSGWISGGPYTQRLEKQLDLIFEKSTSLVVSNGTSALQLAFQVIGLQPEDQVIVPSFCFQAASNIILQLGALPVFCDINPLSWNQSLSTIKQALTPKTKGIVVVHNYGVSAPIEQINSWAKANGLWLIEDCAEAWFTKRYERYVGQFGDLATFSMHATKTISCGEGGVLLVNRDELVDKARLLRSHGLNRSKTMYLHECAGNNYRLSNLLAAVACAQLESYHQITSIQDFNLDIYRINLSGHWAIQLQTSLPLSTDHIWAVAVSIKFEWLSITRDELQALLIKEGIETRPGFYSASELKYHCSSPIKSSVADRLSRSILVLPCGLDLNQFQITRIAKTLIGLIDAHSIKPPVSIVDASSKPNSTKLVSKFYEALGKSRSSFRYFETRSYDIIFQHSLTLLLELNNDIIGYAHLDPQDGRTWLGICIADGWAGRGYGKFLLQELLKRAHSLGIMLISLRVDRDNHKAVTLYESFGFVEKIPESNKFSLYMELQF